MIEKQALIVAFDVTDWTPAEVSALELAVTAQGEEVDEGNGMDHPEAPVQMVSHGTCWVTA